jgi:hypothetical protein
MKKVLAAFLAAAVFLFPALAPAQTSTDKKKQEERLLPPVPGQQEKPTLIVFYLLIIVIVGAGVGAMLIPSRRGHQD